MRKFPLARADSHSELLPCFSLRLPFHRTRSSWIFDAGRKSRSELRGGQMQARLFAAASFTCHTYCICFRNPSICWSRLWQTSCKENPNQPSNYGMRDRIHLSIHSWVWFHLGGSAMTRTLILTTLGVMAVAVLGSFFPAQTSAAASPPPPVFPHLLVCPVGRMVLQLYTPLLLRCPPASGRD